MWCSGWGDGHGSFLDFNFDFDNYKDHYKVLELNSDASDDEIRSNFIRLALKWHPDKLKEEDSATSRFQEINEAYQGAIRPVQGADIYLQWPWDEEFSLLKARLGLYSAPKSNVMSFMICSLIAKEAEAVAVASGIV
ncbi:hypothetical protein Bca4012_029635 [Brassica carinata]